MPTLTMDEKGKESITGLKVIDLKKIAKREGIDVIGLKKDAIMRKLTRELGTRFYKLGGLAKRRKK